MIRRTESLKKWALYLDTFKDRADLSENQRDIILKVAEKVVNVAPSCGWNGAGDYTLSFIGKDCYLDVLIDKRGFTEWFYEHDWNGKPEGTKNDKRPFLPAAFWKRLEDVQACGYAPRDPLDLPMYGGKARVTERI